MAYIAPILTGLLVGVISVVGMWLVMRSRERTLAERVLSAAQEQKLAELNTLVDQLRGKFAELSQNALAANNEQFLTLAKTRLEQQSAAGAEQLETKKKLIDAQLEGLSKRLGELSQGFERMESQRREAHGALRSQLENTSKATSQLQMTTDQLRQALANPQRRGQWGERMAEDVLRLAGFIEGVNYSKQTQLDAGGRPDFSFPLPNNLSVNMDVKFPIANYLKLLETQTAEPPQPEVEQNLRQAFLRDVRGRIKEVTTREYIDPAAGTVDYVLVFIPNEQIYAFVHEHDPTLLDDALRQRVVLCAPLTLYAVLAVMRQVAENFRLEQASREILKLLADFRKQWEKYVEVSDRLGKRLEDATKAYGELTGVRTRQLERQLDKIDNLRDASDGDGPSLLNEAEPQ